MKQKGFSALMILIVLAVLAILGFGGYWIYQNYSGSKGPSTGPAMACTEEAKLCPDGSAVGRTGPNCEFAPCPSPVTGPAISSPKENSKVESPLTIKGTVPPGWMFEGVFPIKLLDSDGGIITEGQAKETIPGSWQSGNIVDFSATISFTTSAKSGFIELDNDNPSGNPENDKNFKIPVNF